jgi:hypothetical protein
LIIIPGPGILEAMFDDGAPLKCSIIPLLLTKAVALLGGQFLNTNGFGWYFCFGGSALTSRQRLTMTMFTYKRERSVRDALNHKQTSGNVCC